MTVLDPVYDDALMHLRHQVTLYGLEQLSLLAAEDPTMFIVEVVSSVKAGHFKLPRTIVQSLKHELSRLRVAEQTSPDQELAPPTSGAVIVDPLVVSQRQVDAVARRVRDHGDRDGVPIGR
jgi:hypothetical protein